jgi:hypothetical protein
MKGQAAMEYLMTYGWAILVVIAVIAALYMMGVFRIGGAPIPLSPSFSYFAFVDYSSSTGILVIRNGARRVNITAVFPSMNISYSAAGANDALNSETTAGTTLYLNTAGLPTGANPITINYTDIDSGLPHSDTATLNK